MLEEKEGTVGVVVVALETRTEQNGTRHYPFNSTIDTPKISSHDAAGAKQLVLLLLNSALLSLSTRETLLQIKKESTRERKRESSLYSHKMDTIVFGFFVFLGITIHRKIQTQRTKSQNFVGTVCGWLVVRKYSTVWHDRYICR